MASFTKSLIFFFIITCSSFTKLLAKKDHEKPLNPISLCRTTNITGTPPQYQTYQTNVASLLSDLASFPSSNIRGFYNTTVGDNNGTAYGSYLCRGDLSSKLCHECVSEATKILQTTSLDVHFDCVGLAGVGLGPSRCMVKYANQSTRYEPGRILTLGSIGAKVPNLLDYFNQTVVPAVDELVREATFGNWSRPNFETKVVDVVGSDEKVYTLVQCTPQISAVNCSKCLGELRDSLLHVCYGTQGGWIVHEDCFMEYNNQSFFGAAHRSFMPSGYLHVCLALLLSIYFIYM